MPSVLEQPPKAKRNRITPRQLHYAELRGSGLSQAEAARQAGYSAKAAACKADRNPIVQQYLNGIQNAARVKAGYTVAIAMEEAKDSMRFAHETKNANAYCKAVELRAKLSGLLIERVEVVSIDLSGSIARAEQRVLTQLTPAEPHDSATPE